MASATNIYDFKPLDKSGSAVPMSTYQGKVVLVVNTASKCGFTPQYEGLQKLQEDLDKEFPDQFQTLAFPCNQFGSQEPGTNEEVQQFCALNYKTSFPVLGKIDVNGSKADPMWEWMKKEKPGLMGMKRIKWNFEKFLIGRDGKVVERWASTTKPEALRDTVVAEIKKGKA